MSSETAPYSNRTTSLEAAEVVLVKHVERIKTKKAVLKAILKAPDGLTCDELEVALGMSHQTASARIRDLVKDRGFIVDSGKVRKTRSGRNAIVWKECIP